jgi:hypothetical protein
MHSVDTRWKRVLMDTQIPQHIHQRLLSVYNNEFFIEVLGEDALDQLKTSEGLLELASKCDTAAKNLQKRIPELSADLANFAAGCREVARRYPNGSIAPQ